MPIYAKAKLDPDQPSIWVKVIRQNDGNPKGWFECRQLLSPDKDGDIIEVYRSNISIQWLDIHEFWKLQGKQMKGENA